MSIRKGNDIIAGTLNTSAYYTKSDIDSLSNGLVHKSGTETINGNKKFTSVVDIHNGGIDLVNNSSTKGTTPSSTLYWGIRANDNTDSSTWESTRLGTLEWAVSTNNIVTGTFNAIKNEASSTSNAFLRVVYDTNNNVGYTEAPTPTTSDNSNKIATTAFVRNLLNNHYITAFQAPNSSDNYKWYRKYADGWVEQGGLLGSAGTYAWRTVTLPVTMANTGYTVVITGAWNDSSGNGSMLGNSKTTTRFNTYATNVNNEGSFYVCGMYAT